MTARRCGWFLCHARARYRVHVKCRSHWACADMQVCAEHIGAWAEVRLDSHDRVTIRRLARKTP
jgi:hypothetical protein